MEDDPSVALLLETTLADLGFKVTVAGSGPEAVDVVAALNPDLITLDLGLPGLDGVEVCRRIRASTDAYVVMLTGRGVEGDLLLGLDVGADDYLTKPFSPAELSARVVAMFRRPRRQSAQTSLVERQGDLAIDLRVRRADYAGATLRLTPTEFQLLAEIMSASDRVHSRAELRTAVWGETFGVNDHLVEVHMANLRRKLRKASGRSLIDTVRGVGYRLSSNLATPESEPE